MGLDMYLYAKKYVAGYDFSNKLDKSMHSKLVAAAGLTKKDLQMDTPSAEVKFCVGYWRKANAIHAWFVKNVQDGVDECEEHNCQREQLTELMSVCNQVLQDKSKANDLLPPQEGFLFGSTEIDEGYIADLEDTIKILTNVLGNPRLADFELSYRSSW